MGACELNTAPCTCEVAGFLLTVDEAGVLPEASSPFSWIIFLDFQDLNLGRCGDARHRSFLLFVVQAEGLPRFRGI
jgi:hypothetical protein